MGYRISALNADEFSELYELDDDTLASRGIKRMRVDTKPGYPCRVTLEDAEIGESVLLLNYEHQNAASPYRSAHAIFIRENAVTCPPFVNEIPEQLRIRLLSIRAFDTEDMIIDADVVDGQDCESTIERLLDNRNTSYLHVHNAKPGCFAARVDRV